MSVGRSIQGARSERCLTVVSIIRTNRTIMTAGLAAIAIPASARIAAAQTPISRITAYGFSFPALEGGDIRLGDFAGRPFLVVNTASQCGYTPQYGGLQELWNQALPPFPMTVSQTLDVTLLGYDYASSTASQAIA